MILYKLVKGYIKAAIFLFYKEVKISGKNNIPKNGPILFVANHQNAMMDPLIVATATNKTMYFLARASAFKNIIAAKLLRTIHAIAIYRVRDGVDSKKLNEAVFDECLDLFNHNKNILIFPEGSHSLKRQVRSLRAGFTRMTIDYLLDNPDKDLLIVPIGLNFDNTVKYAKSLHIIFGEPIKSRNFFTKDDLNKSKGNLIDEVSNQLKKLTVHIDNNNYDEIFNSLEERDFLYPKKTNIKILNTKLQTTNSKLQTQNGKTFFYYLMMLNSVFPFLIWNWIEPKINEKEFISTAKFSLGITAFPIFYLLQALLVSRYFGSVYAIFYLVLSYGLVFLNTKTR